MREQANEATAVIFNGDMPHMRPLHDAGGEVNDVSWLNGKQVCGHNLTDSLVAGPPVFVALIFLELSDGPSVYRLTLFLICQHLGGDLPRPQVRRALLPHPHDRAQSPLCAGLLRSNALLDNAEVSVNIFGVDARREKPLARSVAIRHESALPR